MNIQGFQKLTLLDFPGKVACTVFCGACNLRCPFCHNATLVKHPSQEQNAEQEVLSYLEKRKGILDGVCITGGEPLLQPDLSDFVKKVKEMGYAVKLDTNGSDPEALSALLAEGGVNYVAMDVKSALESYQRAIGVEMDISVFERSMDVLRKSGVEYEFRTTLVKGIHTAEDIGSLGRLLAGEKRYFLQGFVDSGNILGKGCEAFSPGEMKNILSQIRKTVPAAQLRGQEEQ